MIAEKSAHFTCIEHDEGRYIMSDAVNLILYYPSLILILTSIRYISSFIRELLQHWYSDDLLQKQTVPCPSKLLGHKRRPCTGRPPF